MKNLITSFLLLAAMPVVGQHSVIDSLEQSLLRHPNDSLTIAVLNQLSVEYMRTDVKKSQAHLYRALTLAKSLGTTSGISSTYSQLTTSHQNSGNLDSARYYLQKLEGLSKEIPSDRNKGNYYLTAGLFFKNSGNFKIAVERMKEALPYIQGRENLPTRAGQFLNIGNAYFNLGQYITAADYHLQALKLFETLGNARGQSFCIQSLGNDFLELGEFETAVEYFNKSLIIKQQQGDKRGQVTAWSGLGQAHRWLENLHESTTYLKKALELARELKLSREETKILFQYGMLERSKGNESKSKALFEDGLSLAHQSQDSLLIADFQAELASLNLKKSEQDKNESALLNKILTASHSDNKPRITDGHYKIALWYADQEEYKKAFEHLRLFHQFNDSIRGSTVIVQLRDLEKRYETEKKQNEIDLLKKDQVIKDAIIAKQESGQLLAIVGFGSLFIIGGLLVNRYRLINRTRRQREITDIRNTIARDLHDDIGSTLSSINIISRVALKEGGHATHYLERIAKNSAEMMENMSDIVWSIHPAHDSLETIFSRINEFASEILEPAGITCRIQIPDTVKSIRLDVSQRKNLFLIVKEIINNAAKYSEATELLVDIAKCDDLLELTVSDNGKGFNMETLGHGNGMKNIETRAHELRAVLKKSSTESGTVFRLSFSIT